MGDGRGVTSGSSYRHQRQGRLDQVRAVASAMCASTSPHLISYSAEPLHWQQTLSECLWDSFNSLHLVPTSMHHMAISK